MQETLRLFLESLESGQGRKNSGEVHEEGGTGVMHKILQGSREQIWILQE